MHEVQGGFCKSVILWIMPKFAAGKKHNGLNLVGPIGEKNREALGAAHPWASARFGGEEAG